ncbi:MAG TPA: Tox-REase-5 domain-containing protein [Aliidongia sp.]|nr:Tox-REase-5 domain-containing protein [Aliidongia sp.]
MAIGVLDGEGKTGYNPDEPRDERGRWTSGGASWRSKGLVDRGPAGRAAALAGYAYVQLPDRLRRRAGWPDQAATARLARLIQSWNAAGRLDDADFRDRFLGSGVGITAARHLRDAAAEAVRAETSGEMSDAGRHLALAMADIGTAWPHAQRLANEKAANEDTKRQNSPLVPVFAPSESPTIAESLWKKPFGPAWLALSGAAILDAMDRARERGEVEAALKKFDLDPASSRNVLAARAYVWGKNIAPMHYFNVPWEGPVSDAVAIALMGNELEHPGMLGMATQGEPEAQAAIDKLVQETVEPVPPEEAEQESDDDEPRLCPRPEKKIEAMSDESRLYQWQITHLGFNLHMMLNNTDFDGCDKPTRHMLEARARYAQFLTKGGKDWKPFFKFSKKRGWPSMLKKAEEQNAAALADGRMVEYHFAEEAVANLVTELFREKHLDNIIVKHTEPNYTVTPLPETP